MRWCHKWSGMAPSIWWAIATKKNLISFPAFSQKEDVTQTHEECEIAVVPLM